MIFNLSVIVLGGMSGSRSKKNTKAKSLVPYIRSTVKTQIWRATPDEPFIYISFSLASLKLAYGKEKIIDYILSSYDRKKGIYSEEYDLPTIRMFEQIIAKEWIEKAHVPVKFLPQGLTLEELRKKNIVFILAKPITSGIIYTMPFPYPIPDKFNNDYHPHFKIIHFLKHIDLKKNHFIYNVLHETMHAIIEGKHFKPYPESGMDHPPYNPSMTCLDSVMSYKDTCPPVTEKMDLLMPYTKVAFDDPRPEVQALIDEVYAGFPVQLGAADLEAAKDFNRSWKKRNKIAEKTKKPQTSSAQSPNTKINEEFLHNHAELMIIPSQIGGGLSNFSMFKPSIPMIAPVELQETIFQKPSQPHRLPREEKIMFVPELCVGLFVLLSNQKLMNFFYNKLPWNKEEALSEIEGKQLQKDLKNLEKLKQELDLARKSMANQAGLINPETLQDYQDLVTYTETLISSTIKKGLISSAERENIKFRMEQCGNKIKALVDFTRDEAVKKQARNDIIQEERLERRASRR